MGKRWCNPLHAYLSRRLEIRGKTMVKSTPFVPIKDIRNTWENNDKIHSMLTYQGYWKYVGKQWWNPFHAYLSRRLEIRGKTTVVEIWAVWNQLCPRDLRVTIASVRSRLRACRHLATFDPGTTYIYKCDILVSFMPHCVWLMKLTRRSHLYL